MKRSIPLALPVIHLERAKVRRIKHLAKWSLIHAALVLFFADVLACMRPSSSPQGNLTMPKINLYQFNLPTNTNAGLTYGPARTSWEAEALKLAGGYTLAPGFASGVWKGESRVYKETIAVYQVACEPRVGAALEDAFWRLFPDQEALFVADLGPASIINRPPAMVAAE